MSLFGACVSAPVCNTNMFLRWWWWCCRVSACIVLVSTCVLGSCTFLARHWVVRVFTEDPHIRAATAVVVPAVATSIVGGWPAWCLSGLVDAQCV